jgi:hypothetical protein
MCQAILTKEWTTRLPILQKCSPAEVAASTIANAITVAGFENQNVTVVDFCSGAGGPVPTIEHVLNGRRLHENSRPISFLMTDIKPHISSWKVLAAQSASLGYISEPVDATNPPAAVISGHANISPNSGITQPKSRIFRLYCLSFHHFNDDMAKRVLKSTLETADAFAIIELQDRRFWSLILMILNFFVVLFGSVGWFWDDPIHLTLTYVIPVLPVILVFDGIVSALRTRQFDEIISLIDDVLGKPQEKLPIPEGQKKEFRRFGKFSTTRGAWMFQGGSKRHTFPIGYMNWFVGYKESE